MPTKFGGIWAMVTNVKLRACFDRILDAANDLFRRSQGVAEAFSLSRLDRLRGGKWNNGRLASWASAG